MIDPPLRCITVIQFSGAVLTYPDISESATFSFRIRLPSTRFRIFLNPQLFLSGYGFRPHASEYFRTSKISPSTRCRIRCGFIIFHPSERIRKYPDSPNACGRKPYPERKSCRFVNNVNLYSESVKFHA